MAFDWQQWQQPLITVASGIPVALLTAWLTVKFSLKRFRSEKWFERRMDAYTKLIDSLHLMRHTNDRQLRAAYRGVELPKETEEQLVGSYLKGLAEVRRLTDVVALLFPPKAVRADEKLAADLDKATNVDSWWENLDREETAIGTALLELRAIAREDLSI